MAFLGTQQRGSLLVLILALQWGAPGGAAHGQTQKQAANQARQKTANLNGKKFWTYPMTPKIIPTSPLKIAPAFAVPDPFEAYSFKTTEINPNKPTGKIRVYDFDFRGRRILLGELPVGQVVLLESFRRFSNEHYYSFKYNDKTGWLAGRSLAIDGFTPPVK